MYDHSLLDSLTIYLFFVFFHLFLEVSQQQVACHFNVRIVPMPIYHSNIFTLFFMVVETPSEMRNNYVRHLFHRFNLSFVTGLYVLQIIGNWFVQIHISLLSILIHSPRQSHIGVRINEHFEINQRRYIFGDLSVHEDVHTLNYKKFCRF